MFIIYAPLCLGIYQYIMILADTNKHEYFYF